MNEIELQALSYLPERLSDAVLRTFALWNTPIHEIRLREKRLLSVTSCQKNISCEVICTTEEMVYTLTKICGNSLYSYSDAIREGCIPTVCGIRVGVCGHAVFIDGHLSQVRNVTSLNIRIPHRVPGIADELFKHMKERTSVLIYSSPGIGKTTLLRELIPLLASGKNAFRTAVIDTRYELCAGMDLSDFTDVFYGYPRYDGIMSAVRTMSPEYIICDEISTEQDAHALLYAHASGIAVCASIHAGSTQELKNITIARTLLNAHIFDFLYEIRQEGSYLRTADNEDICYV